MGRGYFCGDNIPQNWQNVPVQKLFDISGADAVVFGPTSVILGQFAEGDAFQLRFSGYMLGLNPSGLRHCPLFLEGLRTLTCADILLQFAQQRDGFIHCPTIRCPAQSLKSPFTLSAAVAYSDISVRAFAMPAGRVFAVDNPFLARDIIPSLPGHTLVCYGAHMVPTSLVLAGMAGNQYAASYTNIQQVKYLRDSLEYYACFLLSCRPQVRFLPGAPEIPADYILTHKKIALGHMAMWASSSPRATPRKNSPMIITHARYRVLPPCLKR